MDAQIIGTGVVGPNFVEDDPVRLLGARGLRYRDEATRLALASVQLALEDQDASYAGVTGVVASSNFGNLDTVCRVSNSVHSRLQVPRSPMDLPNASSNIVASSIAIRFGFRGPNIMSCSGASSGLDAMRWAEVLLAARRADRVVVVGVEVDNEVVEHFSRPRGATGLFHGAACVVLERPSTEARSNRSSIGGHASGECLSALTKSLDVDRWFVPDEGRPDSPPPNLQNLPVIDLTAGIGAASGALGVLQAVSAVEHGGNSLLTVGGRNTPFARCLVTSTSTTKAEVYP